MTNLSLKILLIYLLTPNILSQIKQLPINYSIFNPHPYQDRLPLLTYQKLISQDFVIDIKQINFQLLSNLSIINGSLYGDDIYNQSKYQVSPQKSLPKCKLYKTDLKIPQYPTLKFSSPPSNTLVIQSNIIGTNGQFATIYLVNGNKTIITEVFLGKQYANQQINDLDLTKKAFRIQQNLSTIDIATPASDQIHLLNINNTLYIITKSQLIRYNKTINIQQYVTGFQNVNSSKIVKAQVFLQNYKIYIYTITSKQIRIFQLVSDLKVTLIKTITQLKNTTLLTSLYNNGYLYLTSLNKLFLIDIRYFPSYTISSITINGTCNSIDKFQTTLHLGCTYDKLYYIAQFYINRNSIFLNRFYANQDIQGRVVAKRISMGKLGILTDNDFRVTNYGINRNVLLAYGQPQPQFIFNIRYGIDIIPIKIASSGDITTLALICSDQLIIAKILQTPPQLYCQFPKDAIGASYQVLLQFNTSRCSYVQQQFELLNSAIQSICTIYKPLTIISKQSQYQIKQTNLIQFILIVLVIFIIIVIVSCAIKYYHQLQSTFKHLQQQLENKITKTKNSKTDI